MKTTIVPAQVTTVEDKIAGRLGLSQLILLVTPIFFGGLVYAIMPPFIHYAVYKLVIFTILFVLFGTLAIRIRGKIILLWLIVLATYNLRPRYYVFNKNHIHMRQQDKPETVKEATDQKSEEKQRIFTESPQLATHELVKLEELLASPAANFSLKTNRKGHLSVYITEVK